MQYCEECKVHVRTQHEFCPLCHAPLTGKHDANDILFPTIENSENAYYHLFMQWFTFGAVALVIVCGVINWLTDSHTPWSLFVLAGVTCTWLVVFIGVAKRHNLMKNALWQLLILEPLLLLWDVCTGWHGWWVNYFLPLGILLVLAFMLFVALLQKLSSPEYMIYVLMVCAMGVVPPVLLARGIATSPIPSVLCGAVCLLLFAAVLIFRRADFASELHKKFHI